MDPVRAARLRLLLSTDDDDRNQLRRELCLARGVHPDDIDPDTGHDISRDAYERVRTSWRDLITDHGWTEYVATDLHKARARWEKRRPEWTRNDPWIDPTRDAVPHMGPRVNDHEDQTQHTWNRRIGNTWYAFAHIKDTHTEPRIVVMREEKDGWVDAHRFPTT